MESNRTPIEANINGLVEDGKRMPLPDMTSRTPYEQIVKDQSDPSDSVGCSTDYSAQVYNEKRSFVGRV